MPRSPSLGVPAQDALRAASLVGELDAARRWPLLPPRRRSWAESQSGATTVSASVRCYKALGAARPEKPRAGGIHPRPAGGPGSLARTFRKWSLSDGCTPPIFAGACFAFRPYSDRVSGGLRTRGVRHVPASQAPRRQEAMRSSSLRAGTTTQALRAGFGGGSVIGRRALRFLSVPVPARSHRPMPWERTPTSDTIFAVPDGECFAIFLEDLLVPAVAPGPVLECLVADRGPEAGGHAPRSFAARRSPSPRSARAPARRPSARR